MSHPPSPIVCAIVVREGVDRESTVNSAVFLEQNFTTLPGHPSPSSEPIAALSRQDSAPVPAPVPAPVLAPVPASDSAQRRCGAAIGVVEQLSLLLLNPPMVVLPFTRLSALTRLVRGGRVVVVTIVAGAGWGGEGGVGGGVGGGVVGPGRGAGRVKRAMRRSSTAGRGLADTIAATVPHRPLIVLAYDGLVRWVASYWR